MLSGLLVTFNNKQTNNFKIMSLLKVCDSYVKISTECVGVAVVSRLVRSSLD